MPDLISDAIGSLGIRRESPRHSLADLPDGDYKIPVSFVGKKGKFDVQKRGSVVSIKFRDDWYNVGANGDFSIAFDSNAGWTQDVGDKLSLSDGKLSIDARQVTNHYNNTVYGGGALSSTRSENWTGAPPP